MAYGLDVEEIYYTDSSKEDLGVLDTISSLTQQTKKTSR